MFISDVNRTIPISFLILFQPYNSLIGSYFRFLRYLLPAWKKKRKKYWHANCLARKNTQIGGKLNSWACARSSVTEMNTLYGEKPSKFSAKENQRARTKKSVYLDISSWRISDVCSGGLF